MTHLPPVTWQDVATKDDVRMSEAALRGEIAELRGEMRAGFSDVRTEIAEGVTRQIKWMVTFAAAWSTLLITVVRLLP